MWGCFMHSTTCSYVPFIVHKGIKWHMSTTVCSQCPILFPCFFYNLYISFIIQNFFHSLVHVCFFYLLSCMYYMYMYIQRDCVLSLQKVSASILPCMACAFCIHSYLKTAQTTSQQQSLLCKRVQVRHR